MKNILHLSRTYLAGSPIRIVQNINKHLKNKYNARLITEYEFGAKHQKNLKWDLDLLYNKSDYKKYQELYNDADIIHVHNNLKTQSISSNHVIRKKCIFHHHDTTVKEEQAGRFTYQTVVGQYQPRIHPNSYILPNILFFDEFQQEKKYSEEDGKVHIFFSFAHSLEGQKNWYDKGVRYVDLAIESLKKKHKDKFVFHRYTNTPFKELMKIKSRCDINIDDIRTGSYHLSSLEAFYFGMVSICFLDNKTKDVLSFLTDSKKDELPFVEASPKNIEKILETLIIDKDILKQWQEYSIEWYNTFYNPKKMLLFYEDLYDSIIKEEKPKKCKTFKELTN